MVDNFLRRGLTLLIGAAVAPLITAVSAEALTLGPSNPSNAAVEQGPPAYATSDVNSPNAVTLEGEGKGENSLVAQGFGDGESVFGRALVGGNLTGSSLAKGPLALLRDGSGGKAFDGTSPRGDVQSTSSSTVRGADGGPASSSPTPAGEQSTQNSVVLLANSGQFNNSLGNPLNSTGNPLLPDNSSFSLVAPSAEVPEPMTAVAALIGGGAVWHLRKKLTASVTDAANADSNEPSL